MSTPGWTVLLSSAGASLVDLGMALCFGNLLQKAQAQGDAVALQRSLGVAQSVYLALVALLAVLGGAALGLGAATTLAAGRIDAAEATTVLALLGAATLLRVTRRAMAQLYRAHRQFARGILVDLAAPLAVAAAGIAAALAIATGDARRAAAALRAVARLGLHQRRICAGDFRR